jgi:nanoRNase/pAp phosphatase (c-di-AMP/oligoRNAs hydrolase)
MDKTALQFQNAVSKYKNIALYIPGSPDPDAIASAYAIKIVLRNLSINSEIFAEKKLSLPQNQAFLDTLKIPVIFGKTINHEKFEAYIITDFQNNRVESFGDAIPCAAHIDHHGESKSTVKSDFTLIRTDSGSTSTLVALIIKNLGITFENADLTAIATALTFGIQTDTDKYDHTTPLDIEALNYLSDFADIKILSSINNIPVSPETILCYKKGLANGTAYKDWGMYGIGYIDAKNRDSMAISADMILKNSGRKTVAVYAIIENKKKNDLYLDVSFRSESSKVDLNRVIKRITPNGGGRQYKGAYQIKLNYFINAPDRNLLWNIVETTTIETLKKSRDNLHISELESFYSNIKKQIFSFLKKDSDIS